MEKDVAEKAVTGVVDTVFTWFKEFGLSFSEAMFAWTFGQLALIALAWLLAVLVARIVDKPVEEQLRNIRGNRALLRILVVLRNAIRAFLLVVFLWMLVMGDQGLFRLGQLHELKDDLLSSRQRISDEIDDKAREEQLLQDPKNLEMIIRKELGYIRPGEVIYQEPEKKR